MMLQSLVMFVVEEDRDGRLCLGPRPRLYLGQGELARAVTRGGVAVQVDVPAGVDVSRYAYNLILW